MNTSVLGFYCYKKHHDQSREKNFFWLIYSDHNSSLRKVRAGTQGKTKAEARKECCLLSGLLCLPSLCNRNQYCLCELSLPTSITNKKMPSETCLLANLMEANPQLRFFYPDNYSLCQADKNNHPLVYLTKSMDCS